MRDKSQKLISKIFFTDRMACSRARETSWIVWNSRLRMTLSRLLTKLSVWKNLHYLDWSSRVRMLNVVSKQEICQVRVLLRRVQFVIRFNYVSNCLLTYLQDVFWSGEKPDKTVLKTVSVCIMTKEPVIFILMDYRTLSVFNIAY